MRVSSRLPRSHVTAGLLVCIALSGCVLGPKTLELSRTNYNRAVQQTAREEILLNLVRMKYDQSVEFLRVASITGQYTFDGSIGGKQTWKNGTAAAFELPFGVGATTRPTIVFAPEQSQEFNKRLLAPVSLATIHLLTSKAWAIDRVLRLTVRNINDVANASSAGGPTPALKPEFEEFRSLVDHLRDLQANDDSIEIAYEDRETDAPIQVSGEIPAERVKGEDLVLAAEKGFRFRLSNDKQFQTLWTRGKTGQALVLRIAPNAKGSFQLREIVRTLELAPGRDFYPIKSDKYGQLKRPNSRRQTPAGKRKPREELVISTRSLKEMMFYLCHGIAVPSAHVKKGFVQQTFDNEGRPFDWGEMTGDLFCVHVSKFKPRDAAVAVRHRGYWFSIDASDQNSKRTFNLLLELFNLEIRAGGGGALTPLLTI